MAKRVETKLMGPATYSDAPPEKTRQVLDVLQLLEKSGVQLLTRFSDNMAFTTEVVGVSVEAFYTDTLSPPSGDELLKNGAYVNFETMAKGVAYEFVAPFMGKVEFLDQLPAFKFGLPGAVVAKVRRQGQRVRLDDEATVSFLAPFSCDARVANIGLDGLAFDHPGDTRKLKAGEYIPDMLIELGDSPVISVNVEVASNMVLELGGLTLPSLYRTGVRFLGMADKHRKVLEAFLSTREGWSQEPL